MSARGGLLVPRSIKARCCAYNTAYRSAQHKPS